MLNPNMEMLKDDVLFKWQVLGFKMHRFCCLFVCLFVSFFLSFFLCLFLCLFVCLFVCLFLCFFVSLFLCFFVCLFVSFFLCFFVCLFVCRDFHPTHVQVYAAGKWLIYGDRPFYPILLMVKAPVDIQNNHICFQKTS